MKQPTIDEKQDPGLHRIPLIAKVKATATPALTWTRDKVDTRDYAYTPTAVKILNVVDLRSYCSPVEDQGNLGSCTGNAIAEAIEMLDKRNGKNTERSRLFVYYYERLLEGTVNRDSGAYIRDGIKVTYNYGVPLESLWPYDVKKYRVPPSKEANADALRRKVTLYERAADFNSCINALTNGYPVVVGFEVYASFMGSIVGRTGIMPYPNTKTEPLLGGHAVLLVGYDNSKQWFIVKNSWGSSWGDKGYFYMPYRVIQNPSMSGDFWVIKQVNNP